MIKGKNLTSLSSRTPKKKSLCTVTFFPGEKQVHVPVGTSLLHAAGFIGITPGSLCGGKGTCGRCKMIVRSGKVTSRHFHKLSPEQVKIGYVLGCLSYLNGDATVEIPAETHVMGNTSTQDDTQRFRDFADQPLPDGMTFSPCVRKVYLELEPPSLSGNFADHQRLSALVCKKLGINSVNCGLKVIKTLPSLFRKNKFKITATVGIRQDFSEIINVEPGNTEDQNFIAVVDMGTTTVVVHLIDVFQRKTLDAMACFNSQSMYGADVTTRLMAAEKAGCGELQKLLVNDINRLIAAIAQRNKVDVNDITAVVCAGNTVMGHFLLGLPIENIRRFPYIPVSVEPPSVYAAEVGLAINPTGLLFSLPGVSGWVGSDLTAGILATGLHKSVETCLLVDIGTNGEVIVGNKEWMMACSASAGPGLEGASVECGMRAEPGAIERVHIDEGEIRFKTIGENPPRGICGSGIIDLVHTLLCLGIINRGGKITGGSSDRIFEKDGIKVYVLVKRGQDGCRSPVFISETDIANIISAKAAIYAAMKILIQRLDLSFLDIKKFFIAGAFGSYLDVESAIGIGLIPNISRERIHFVGNTSVRGAKIAALCKDGFDQIVSIERSTTYYDLMGAADYVEEFSRAMFLPHTDIELFSGPA
jgi:uncharacterized 2Fe-2S/4Fe-4S cluster protein (DUF4445 family)